MDKNDDKKRSLEIIISGTTYGMMDFPEGINITGLRNQVLDKTNNTAQALDNWEVKDENGVILDLGKHLRDYATIKQLWFTVKAGIGG